MDILSIVSGAETIPKYVHLSTSFSCRLLKSLGYSLVLFLGHFRLDLDNIAGTISKADKIIIQF